MIEKINKLIGKPYDRRNYHCWSFIEEIYPNAPKIDYVQENLYNSIKKFEENLKIQKFFFKYIEKPENFDIILLGNKKGLNHVGIYYEDSIIHNDVQGVRVETLKSIKARFNNSQYIRLINNDNNCKT